MDLQVAYLGRSGLRRTAGGVAVSLAPNLRRDRVSFVGTLRSPLRFREAVSALHDVVVSDLRQETFFANIVLDVDGKRLEIDSRTSDAIALAVRTSVKIFVSDAVMESAGIVPEEDISTNVSPEEQEHLSAFSDFIDTLDLDDLGKEDKQ